MSSDRPYESPNFLSDGREQHRVLNFHEGRTRLYRLARIHLQMLQIFTTEGPYAVDRSAVYYLFNRIASTPPLVVGRRAEPGP